MDLNNITTVNDLLSENTKTTPTERAIDAIKEMDANERIRLCAATLAAVQEWCVEMAKGNIAGELPESGAGKAAAWADDAASLRSALRIIHDLEV
jgi:ABC-type uncharacterized transport system ATPase subunit